jgi:hypothetical protein
LKKNETAQSVSEITALHVHDKTLALRRFVQKKSAKENSNAYIIIIKRGFTGV